MATGSLPAYRLTPAALADLEDIWRYTAEIWSPGQADAYIDTLQSTLEMLLSVIEIAREWTEFTPPVRIHPTGQHLIVYRIQADCLAVVRILGGKQNWQAVLRLDD